MHTLDARILRWARETPDTVALVGDSETLTWRQFSARVDDWLERLQLQPGQALGWLAPNSVDMLAALLACAASQAVFVPLNTRLAAPELATIVTHAGVARLHASAELGSGLAAPSQAHRFEPGDLLLAYTSGTTGTPKGAIHTTAAMLANIDAAIQAQGFGRDTRALAVLPLFHVGGLCIQVLPVLAAGGQVRLHGRFDPAAWLRDVAQWQATTSLVVPAVMRALVDHPDWMAADLGSLRFVGAGSSIIPRALIDAFHARGIPVLQIYGATETGPVSVVLKLQDALAQAGSAGRPAQGVEVKLVDGQGHEVTSGEVGEVCVRGANLMRGYHREPMALREGWFHSGDLGCINEAGFLQIVGRSKDMIISGGENIYPAEIENLLADHPDVAEAAVVGLPDERWGEVPVLVVVPRPGRSVDLGMLHAHFEGRLARYKLPRRIVVKESLPKTALGKVRKADLVAELLT